MTFGYSGMLLWAFRVYALFNDFSSVATGCAYGVTFTILCVIIYICSSLISLISPALAQTQYRILRLGNSGLGAQLWSNNLRTLFRDNSFFIPLRICLGAQQRWWWRLYWRHMLEPHVLGVHWRGPSVFRCKHSFRAAMEWASLGDSTHEPLLGFPPSSNLERSDD